MGISEAHVLLCAGAILDSAMRSGVEPHRACEMAAGLAWELADRVSELRDQDKRIKALPHDPEAERILLSTTCAPGATGGTRLDALIREIDPVVFFVPAHAAIFGALRSLVEQGQEVTPNALAAVLEAEGTFGRVGGYQGLLEAIGGEEVAKPEVLAHRLQDLQRRREMIRLGWEIVRKAEDLSCPIVEDRP